MAAPVKNFLNPSTISSVWQNYMPLPKMPWRDMEYAPVSVWIRSHQDYIVPRWTIPLLPANPTYPTIPMVPIKFTTARTNSGRIAQIITFPSVYRSQDSGSTRPSVGQQWPRGVK